MCAIGNGLATYGLLPFTSTFLGFSTYCAPSIRSCAMDQLRQIFVFSHDSILMGPDGPSHQPVGELATLRNVPNLNVFRPNSVAETLAAFKASVLNTKGPTAICVSRQRIDSVKSVLTEEGEEFDSAKIIGGTLKGGYVLYRGGGFNEQMGGQSEGKTKRKEFLGKRVSRVVLIATGSEVTLALKTALGLREKIAHVSVVSAPCLDILRQQNLEYRRSLVPIGTLAISVEAGSSSVWPGFAHYSVSVESFGASGRQNVLCGC